MSHTPRTLYLDHCRTTNPLNGSHGHWVQRSRHAKAQRQLVYQWLHALLRDFPRSRFQGTILLTRVAPRTLDPDGLAASLKHIQDGLADYLTGAVCGHGTDAIPGVTWRYAQRRGGVREYGVAITFLVEAPVERSP